MITPETYRAFPAVANSDLSWLQKYWEPENLRIDKEKAFRFGNLLDAIITEPHRVNYYKYTVDSIQFTAEEFKLVEEMKKSYMRDAFCQNMNKHCVFQHISYQPFFNLEHDGIGFSLPAKCKWDLFCKTFDLAGDIKSTAATTAKQFEEACHYFDYFRSRAWYMDIAHSIDKRRGNNDVLIGISKKNCQVFKIQIKRGDKYHSLGCDQYRSLAYRWWSLFGDMKKAA